MRVILLSILQRSSPGSAIGVVTQGTFGIIGETDCVLRTYNAGEVFFHRGQGIIDIGFNAGEGDVVVYLMFIRRTVRVAAYHATRR